MSHGLPGPLEKWKSSPHVCLMGCFLGVELHLNELRVKDGSAGAGPRKAPSVKF